MKSKFKHGFLLIPKYQINKGFHLKTVFNIKK